jgi:nicotinamidase-related amidase
MSWNAREHDEEWPFDSFATDFTLDPGSTALLVIDIQAGSVVKDPESELGRTHPAIVDYWNRRVRDQVLPNTRRLIESFRRRGLRVVYTRNGAMTPSGDEQTGRLRSRDVPGPDRQYRGGPAYEIAAEVSPNEHELIIDKPISSAFTASPMDHVLRNMGVTDLVITGILTDMCVLGTARVGAELGYSAVICEDACATLTQRAHDEALLMHARVFGRVSDTEDVLAELDMGTAQ